jgi:hypothetical protein
LAIVAGGCASPADKVAIEQRDAERSFDKPVVLEQARQLGKDTCLKFPGITVDAFIALQEQSFNKDGSIMTAKLRTAFMAGCVEGGGT